MKGFCYGILAMLFLVSGTVMGQVSSFPYFYNWDNATTIQGDGNYTVDTVGTSSIAFACASSGTNYYPECGSFKNGTSNLNLLLNTSGRTFTGSEIFSFLLSEDTRGGTRPFGKFNVLSEGNGDTATLYSDTMSTTRLNVPVTILLPATLGNDANARIVLQVTFGGFGSGKTAVVRVDNFSLTGGALPIQLASFSVVSLTTSGVSLTWSTASETNNYGFSVQRNGVDIAFVAGHGTTLERHTYTYTDNPPSGQYQYRLKQVDLDGTAMMSESLMIDVSAPRKLSLGQNFPNPFNPSTRISFAVSKEGPVTLRVYDILGREVATLVNENRKPGEYTERFDGSRVASGMYLYVLQSSEGQRSSRMILSK